MKDTDLYAQILGVVAPWVVTNVELDPTANEIRVQVRHHGEARCPDCGKTSPRYDHRERRWRHLDTCQLKTILVAELPRTNCAEHGVKQVNVPWAEPGSGFTALFESLVIDWLKQTGSTSGVRRMLQLSWTALDNIMQRAVRRGQLRQQVVAPKHMSVDETSFQRRHEYVTVVTDQETGTVVHVADGRTKESLDGFFETLTEEQKAAIESVSMDMWEAYICVVRKHVPEADWKICFDKFHVAKYLADAVDRVRRQENRVLLKENDDRLKGTKHLWLENPNTMRRDRWAEFRELYDRALKTARAWALKESAMQLWHYTTRRWALKMWMAWLSRAVRCRLEPMLKAAKTIKDHLWGIINAVVLNRTNATAESINARIQRIKRNACGFRNRARFGNAIYFYLGGLDLYPRVAVHTV